MHIDEGNREEHLQDALREGISATSAVKSATGQAQLAPWRTEPEIGLARQEQLRRCLATTPDITRGIYPFKGMKLSRADIEWLLATHEDERGLTAGAAEHTPGEEEKQSEPPGGV
jgi:hypothetical protein